MTTTTPAARATMDHERWCAHATSKDARGKCRNALRALDASVVLAQIDAAEESALRARGIDAERAHAIADAFVASEAVPALSALALCQQHDTLAGRAASTGAAGALGALVALAPVADDAPADE